MTYEEVLDDFPYLTQEEILACLSYAADRERQMQALHFIKKARQYGLF